MFTKVFLASLAALTLSACQKKEEAAPVVPPEESPAAQVPEVVVTTNQGEIRLVLHPESAPLTVANFLEYVDEGFYDGTIFHRVISNFMIQGGGFALQDGLAKEKETGPGVKNESPQAKSNVRGTIAMARTNDPDSATAQFFINVSDNDGSGPVTNLDYPASGGHGYTVFGEVISGMEVVDTIKEVPTHRTSVLTRRPNGRFTAAQFADVPLEPVIIESIRRMTPTDDEDPGSE